MRKTRKQPNPFISGQVYNFKPINFRISKNEYSVFSFEFKEKDRRAVTVYVASDLKLRLIQELKEHDIVGVKLDRLDRQYSKLAYKLRDFKVYSSATVETLRTMSTQSEQKKKA